ncbi:hypothetical protein ROZALSC1DRAFT_28495 [Rozella allomycis CSF55]|uniref:Mediator of RNA polymerase II transcription subunit 25 von Willebrand factor type A domain-containing protein n=1 Tax=Rozella allomycis (strain CSF55) TaxID=988480 RepID=A0A075AU64_ROZAC|nr:hypothetical protein O9G_005215 [Rozella allomycis CSF55]RKP19968.1 hypothetical protein ROZALSC1DRAFT_28495 [Rozella allomycis CSF55]|eukprot:EPZ33841.1 hypothetical protein O9G_005215 [Rozella allomycis CSF55]
MEVCFVIENTLAMKEHVSTVKGYVAGICRFAKASYSEVSFRLVLFSNYSSSNISAVQRYATTTDTSILLSTIERKLQCLGGSLQNNALLEGLMSAYEALEANVIAQKYCVVLTNSAPIQKPPRFCSVNDLGNFDISNVPKIFESVRTMMCQNRKIYH